MGCDIHMFVEYERWPSVPGRDVRTSSWCTFLSNGGSRDYAMFDLLAGVRADGDESKVLYPPRGIPNDISAFGTTDGLTYRIDDNYVDEDGCCSSAKAEEWCARGYSERLTADRITQPDLHSFSWLTTDEFERVLAVYVFDHGRSPDAEYTAMLAAMRSFEERGVKARVVFAFDN